jgi:DNA-binding XRE family transcriptional regulator
MANTFYSAPELAALAKKLRMKSGKTKAALARELKVTRASMQDAEEHPERNMTKLRIAIIEACSACRIDGPLFVLKRR